MTKKGTSGKSPSSGGGRRASTKQVKIGHRYGRFYMDVPIPEIKKGDKGSPSLLAMAFGIKERGE